MVNKFMQSVGALAKSEQFERRLACFVLVSGIAIPGNSWLAAEPAEPAVIILLGNG
jgi:hypothetical protein